MNANSKEDLRQTVQRYGASIPFDRELAREDITGSLAHAAMLSRIGVLSAEEAETLRAGLLAVAGRIEAGTFDFGLIHEDIHMAVETALRAAIGPLGGKLHTGRSRNDQVALDMRLYLRKRVLIIIERLTQLQRVLRAQALRHLDTILPGYTHLQRGQPVLLAHHLLAYGWMFSRDAERMRDAWTRINRLPLGAGGLAGTSFPLDRGFVAELLAFDELCENSMDAVSDRDFIVEFLADAALCMAHLSRLGEELVLWSSAEFGYIRLPDPFCTGSSIMPQKRNPDMAELGRGKAGRVYGALMGLLTVMKGLPLTYNKDLQEDKEGMIDAVCTVSDTLSVFSAMIEGMEFDAARMRRAADESFANATDLADYLAKRGVPFREAHGIVKDLVIRTQAAGKRLDELPLTELQAACSLIAEDVYPILGTEAVVAARTSRGGTARGQVEAQFEHFDRRLQEIEGWHTQARCRVAASVRALWGQRGVEEL